MCGTCGCGSSEMTMTNLETGRQTALGEDNHEHVHADGTRHSHSHDHAHSQDPDHHHHGEHHRRDEDRDHHHERTVSVIDLNSRILAKNDATAGKNRAWLKGREILAINLMSAPGAGKTTLLERTIASLKDKKIFVLEGDQATDHDGVRVKAAGASAVQINTGQGCHLDAEMLARGLGELKPAAGSVLFIENVGNLVCPALFDLGETRRVAILSVTEGDDKPLKYPHMFRAADLMLLNKIDLAPHVRFDRNRAIAYARQINPVIEVLELSAQTAEGIEAWLDWIAISHAATRSEVFA
jgi:hydrogenase nickel incorporation protein HypB